MNNQQVPAVNYLQTEMRTDLSPANVVHPYDTAAQFLNLALPSAHFVLPTMRGGEAPQNNFISSMFLQPQHTDSSHWSSNNFNFMNSRKF